MLRQTTSRTIMLLCCFAAAPSCNSEEGNSNSAPGTAAGNGNTTHSGGSTATTDGNGPGSGGNLSGASGFATGGAAVNGTGGLAGAGAPGGGSGGAGASNGGAPNAGSSSGGAGSSGGGIGGTANGAAANGGSSSSGVGTTSGGSNPSSGGSTIGGSSAKGGAAASGASSAGVGGTSGTGGSSGGVGGGAWTFPTGVTKPRLMIVGDSISAGPGCYKKYLLENLTDNHYSNFEFVGQYTDDCGGGVRHSAVSCSNTEQFTQATFTMPNCSQGKSFPGMSTLMTTHKPDLIMLQLGVNDVWGGRATDAILGSYATLLQQARAQNGNVVLVVAKINQIRPDCSSSDAVTKRAEALVNAVPAWAAAQSSAKSPVFVADLWTNSDWSKAETIDCVHPNDVGAQRMGLNWYNALKGILKPN